jgi:hypothetical protein
LAFEFFSKMYILWMLAMVHAYDMRQKGHEFRQRIQRIGKGVKDFGVGFKDGAIDAGKSLYTFVRHPIASTKGLGYAIKHPRKVGRQLKESIQKNYNQNPQKFAGEAAFVASTFILPQLVELSAVNHVAEATAIKAQTLEVMDIATHLAEADNQLVDARKILKKEDKIFNPQTLETEDPVIKDEPGGGRIIFGN